MFYPDPHGKDGLRSNCKECHRQRIRDYRKRKADDPKWIAAERERQKKRVWNSTRRRWENPQKLQPSPTP